MRKRERLRRRWDTYKRDRFLRSCEKDREETEFMFGRLREVCERLGVFRLELDLETRQKIMEDAIREYRSKKKKPLQQLCRRKCKEPDYTKTEMEEWPEELRKVVEHAFLYEHVTGFLWTLYEWECRWFVKVQHVNEIDKSMWLTVHAAGGTADKNMFLDFFRTKFKGLYFSERYRTLFFDVFRYKTSTDKEERLSYENWVNRLENPGQLFEKGTDGQTGRKTKRCACRARRNKDSCHDLRKNEEVEGMCDYRGNEENWHIT